MKIERVHIEFFTAAPLPAFATRFYQDRSKKYPRTPIPTPAAERARLIDACVNAHAHTRQPPRLSANNTCAVLAMWRTNQAREPAARRQPLADYLRHVAATSPDQRRKGYARNWLSKLLRA